MPKKADVWLRFKGKGKARRADSFYFDKVRLLTKNEGEARARAALVRAGKWPPPEKAAARSTAESFKPVPHDPPPPPPPVPAQLLQPMPVVGAPPDWTAAAAAAGAEGAGFVPGLEPDEISDDGGGADETTSEPPEQISNEQLAQLVVVAQTKMLEIYTRRKVYPGFVAPALAPELSAELAAAYKAMFDYGGTALQLPPWVNGLVVPGISIAMSSSAMVAAFQEIALKQKAAAEAAAGGQ